MTKRLIDILGSASGILVLSPVLVILAVLIKFGSKGPVFFVQDRIGLKGKHFRMFKFRSMVDNAEKKGTGLYSFEGDPRITPIGQFMRRKSLDELPQLFNVLAGDMSLVGPRPPVSYELGRWEDYTEEMRKRFEVKPGITGLAQISGRNDIEWDEKIIFDNRYVDEYARLGALLDIKILFQTVSVVFSGRDTIETEKSERKLGEIATRARAAGRADTPFQSKDDA